jgi:outer membrane protein TolC
MKEVMKKFFYLFTILLSSLTASAQVSMMGDVSPAYLGRLIDTARANYAKFKYSTAKVNAAQASYAKSKAGIFDFASLNYVYYPGNAFSVNSGGAATTSFLNGYQLGVFVNVGTMLSKPATVRQAREELKAAKWDKEVIDLDVDQEVRKRYYTYIQTMNLLRIKTQSLADADDILKNVKYKFEKGQATFEIYNQALLTTSTYSQDKISAEAALLIAKSSLEEILGTTLENLK